jgi:hypothetical protein
MTRINQ